MYSWGYIFSLNVAIEKHQTDKNILKLLASVCGYIWLG